MIVQYNIRSYTKPHVHWRTRESKSTINQPLPWTVPTGAENAFIYLTVSAGPSDFLFLGADYK